MYANDDGQPGRTFVEVNDTIDLEGDCMIDNINESLYVLKRMEGTSAIVESKIDGDIERWVPLPEGEDCVYGLRIEETNYKYFERVDDTPEKIASVVRLLASMEFSAAFGIEAKQARSSLLTLLAKTNTPLKRKAKEEPEPIETPEPEVLKGWEYIAAGEFGDQEEAQTRVRLGQISGELKTIKKTLYSAATEEDEKLLIKAENSGKLWDALCCDAEFPISKCSGNFSVIWYDSEDRMLLLKEVMGRLLCEKK